MEPKLGTAYIDVEGNFDKFDDDTKRAIGKARSRFSGLAKAATAGLALGGGALGIDLAKKSIEAASDVNESVSKNRVLFGRYAKQIVKFSEDSGKSFGISKRAVLEYTGTFGNLFRALGLTRRQSARYSVDLTKLAADMASFNNTSPEEALEAIRSGLVGETEPLRKYGVNIQDATLRTEALRLGLVKTTKEALDPQTKALAAQSLIVKQTSAAHGDFERTSKGLANQQRILGAQWDDLKAKLGKALLPLFKDAVTKVNEFVTQMEDGTGAGGDFVDALEDIRDVLKSVIGFLKDHKTAVKIAVGAWVAYRVAAKLAITRTRLALAAQFFGLGSRATAAGTAAGGRWGGAFNKAARARLLKLLPAGLTVTVAVAFQWAVNKAIAKLLNIPATNTPVGRTFNPPGAVLDDIVHGRNPLKGNRRGKLTEPYRSPGGTIIRPNRSGDGKIKLPPTKPHAPSGRTLRAGPLIGEVHNHINVAGGGPPDPDMLSVLLGRKLARLGAGT